MSYTNLGLSPALLKVLVEQNYTHPYPIQKEAIPAILNKKDVLGIAKTGSGKTASYVLPLLMNLQGHTETKNRHVNVLVLVPTRELAIQVNEVFQLFGAAVLERIKTLAVYGGVSINPQMIALQGVNILVATPGRLIELIESNAVSLSEVETLVLDEADKMLNLGFKKEVDTILAQLPVKRQNLLFSATLNDDVKSINQLLLRNPVVIKIAFEKHTIDLIKQLAYKVTEERKGPLLRYLIKSNDLKQVLVFTSSKYKADNVADKLRKNGIEAAAIHGEKSQKARTEALKKFKAGELRVLVTTDLLARGVDIEQLPHVINYELPRSPKDYVHRIGRTGRADSPGEAISLITAADEHHFKIIQKKMGKQVENLESGDIDLKGF
jgi:ATP-dependent RNA helicase RhlE